MTPDLSPCTGAAMGFGAQVRQCTELLSFRQDERGVTARLRDRADGREFELTADCLIAADGADSPVREALGITRSGVGHLRTLRSVLFSCPEADAFLARGAQQFTIEQDGFRAFLTTYGDSRWVLMFEDDEPRSPEQLRDAVRRALGRDMAFKTITTGRWEMAGRIADAYSHGRVFLAGDAAHQLPPTRGGFGANTGIADAWNLAWKLQRVLAGTSRPALLDTYDAERRPIGWLRHQQTFSRPDYAGWVGADFQPDPLLSNEAMQFGQLVRSAAVPGAGSRLPAAATMCEWAGQPGTRAPHVVLRDGTSTLDLFGRDFVLLTASAGWAHAAETLPLQVVRAGQQAVFPSDAAFDQTFGVTAQGATLVRPDGVIAWRSPGADGDAGATLRLAFTRAAMA